MTVLGARAGRHDPAETAHRAARYHERLRVANAELAAVITRAVDDRAAGVDAVSVAAWVHQATARLLVRAGYRPACCRQGEA